MTFKPPLPLRAWTPPEWAESALRDPAGLLSDHAHNEKKATLTALSLVHAFPDEIRPAILLSRLAEEEAQHFRKVLEALDTFGWKLRPDRGNRHAQGLLAAKDKDRGADPLLDRLLIGSLIEARSCERLWLIEQAAQAHPELGDPQWLAFLLELERCEAGHALTYLRLAQERFPGADARMDWWLDREAEVVSGLAWRSAVH
ncbi:MAG TPA: tRNA isopentenyl-2-thiomethyl-A-37 hydroxylase MiaE [Holophagaceae bacterium]|nr:tRNA isopentenyl-2-thiomethyl-A-37 hydroxylase MiaE [Holophagaceae bacterium]